MTKEIKTEEERASWVKEQFQRANKHLAQSGILFDTVVTQESRYMAPEVAVWKIKDMQNKFYWVISGNLPADAIAASAANSAREAIRYFSLSWQLKAENIVNNAASDNTQKEFAMLLNSKAQMLYAFQEQEEWWQEA